MKPNAQSISLWIATFFGAVLVVAFMVFPGFLPPMSPTMSAQDVAAFYNNNTTMIRASMITFDFCGVMLIPLFMVVVHQIKRMATSTDVFAYCYLSAAASTATLFALSNLLWLIAAFRPERDPQLLVLLNDFAWITFTAPVGTMVGQYVCLALAIYLDGRDEPVLPRWVAHFNIVSAIAVAPAVLAAVFKTGPFAWNGAISFWLRLGAFAVNTLVMIIVLRGVIKREVAESSDADLVLAPAAVG